VSDGDERWGVRWTCAAAQCVEGTADSQQESPFVATTCGDSSARKEGDVSAACSSRRFESSRDNPPPRTHRSLHSSSLLLHYIPVLLPLPRLSSLQASCFISSSLFQSFLSFSTASSQLSALALKIDRSSSPFIFTDRNGRHYHHPRR